jgi:hypothetical protein
VIKQIGSYRGAVIEHAVSVTSSGLPQMAAKFRALEIYDFEEKAWMDWSAEEECEITAYLVLFNKDGEPIFHADDIRRIFEWDGASLESLNDLDLEGAEVQFDVISDNYKDKPRIKVARILGYEDTPGSGAVKQMDSGDLSKLNAKFGAALKKLSGGPKAASAPATPPKAPGKAKAKPKVKAKAKAKPKAPPAPTAAAAEEAAAAPAEPFDESTITNTPEKETVESVEAEMKVDTKKKTPAPPRASGAKAAVPEQLAAEYDYNSAWEACYGAKAETVSDDVLSSSFSAAMYRIAPNQSEDEITGENWSLIVEGVAGECGIVKK